jgi:hypothetical protein
MKKIIIGIIVVLVIAGGVWYWMNKPSGTSAPADSAISSTAQNDQTAAVAMPKPSLTTSPSDSSDTALDTDLKTVDGDLSGLSADSATVGNTITESSAQ